MHLGVCCTGSGTPGNTSDALLKAHIMSAVGNDSARTDDGPVVWGST